MINNVVLVGRLTKDPELRYSSSNIPMVYFTVAVNRTFADQNGQRQADFIGGVAFRKQAENMARFLGRGSLIGVEGRIQTRNYQGKDGNTVYVTEVVADRIQFLESKSSSNRQNNGFDSMSFNQPQSQHHLVIIKIITTILIITKGKLIQLCKILLMIVHFLILGKISQVT